MKIKEEEIRNIVSKNLRTIRHFNGLTLKDVAQIVNTTHQQVQKYEVGKSLIPIDRLLLLAKHLKLPITFFVTEFEFNQKTN